MNELEIPVVSIRFSVYDGDMLFYTTRRPIIIGDLSETNERILRQADELLKSGRLCPYDKYYLKQRIQFAHRVGSAANAVWTQTGFIRSVLKHFSNGLKMADVFHVPKNHIIHFRNPLDNQTDTYSAVTPDDYDQANLYSLIININNANFDNQNVFYNYNPDKKAIFADIYLKGINLGSYVGEASFFAYLNDIKKRFSIDENRIYITGGCNGGSAVYSLAQNYPHLFAAVLSVTGSSFLPSIGNLYNLPVYNVYSEADENFSDLKREQKERLESLPLAKNINVESCSHRIIMSSMQRSNVLDALLSHTRNMYPEHIKYRTERNYHRKCYWIELLGISFGKCFCEAEVFASSSLIAISLTNCLGIKIEIPPYINRNDFCIKLNEQVFTFSKYRKKHIIIVQRNGIYEITDICPVVSQIKGMGILSVYLRPLRIICDTSDLIQMNAAQKLSEPVTMGYKSKMLVRYPISDHFARLPAKCNMIMIRKYDCKTAYDDLMQVRCEKTDIVIIMFIMKIHFIILKTFSTSRHRRFGNKSAHIVISIICCSSQRTGKHIVLRNQFSFLLFS